LLARIGWYAGKTAGRVPRLRIRVATRVAVGRHPGLYAGFVEFTAEEVERARRYHRPLYAALAADLVLGAAVLLLLALPPVGDAVYRSVDGLPWPARAVAFAALVVVLSALVRLPLAFWRGYLHERRWGFSTQTAPGWLADRAKGGAIGIGLSALALLGLVALARALPGWWPVPAAAAAAILVLLLTFVAPVVLEPVFNRFEPLADDELVESLRALADRAGVPVRDVLVADASRRTTKSNAYVSGLGRTRRVVVYDTLLERASPAEIRLVVAHELGHRRDRHVVKGTLLAMAGAAAGVLLVWAVLGTRAADPRDIPWILLVAVVLELAGLPPTTALSRRWERAADRLSLELTHDPAAFEAAHRSLALSNLADLDPPRPLYLVLFTHPTPPERLAAARAWRAAHA
jgi:Zn-dependent protease with chaperone function